MSKEQGKSEPARGSGSAAKTPMTQSDASRIQRHADRSGTNQGFKGRAQSSAAKNSPKK